ncbi:uncharacterized protein LOC124163859 isoform X2 [Ischnura elegans]|nr:uncharacterized protein LOC124163859 isoform X2 [Ischnura elegans]
MVIQRGTVETWRLPSETRIPHRNQLIVTDVSEENDATELHVQFPFNHEEAPQRQILKSGSSLESNDEAEPVPQVCRAFPASPMKKIKLEPQEWVEWKNALNLKQATLAALPANCSSGNGSNSPFHGKLGVDKSDNGAAAAVRALDLLRQNLQKVINQEIDLVISRYLEKFFQPAVENIKDNLGAESVTQDMLRKVCRQVLEEAKLMYSPVTNSHVASESQSLFKSSHLKLDKNRYHKLNIPKISKLEVCAHSSKRKSLNQKFCPSEYESPKKKQKGIPTICSKVANSTSSSSKPSSASHLHLMLSNTSGQTGSQLKPLQNSVASNSPKVDSSHTAVICNSSKSKGKEVMPANVFPKWDGSKWAASRIVSQTLFVMGARANKALGFGQMRGRLYIKHPELFKYSGDQEDKEWLTRNHLMPPTGGKAYLMIVEDIRQLAETEEYRNNPNLLLDEIHGFEVPDFMLRKIRCYVNSLRMEELNSSNASGNGKTNCAMKGKVQQNHSKKLPPPVIKTVSCQYDNKKRKEEPKNSEVVSPIKSILETKLREDKSPLSSPSGVQNSIIQPSTTKSCTMASVSSSTNDNKITLKSLLESKTSLLSLGDKHSPGK